MGGFAALIVVLGAGMRWFLETYAQQFTALIGG